MSTFEARTPIPGEITGTLGTAKKIRFRAWVCRMEHGHLGTGTHRVSFTWHIQYFDPRWDDRGYNCNTHGREFEEGGHDQALRQLHGVLRDWDATLDDPTLLSFWLEDLAQPVVLIDREEKLADAGVITSKDRTNAERSRRYRENHPRVALRPK